MLGELKFVGAESGYRIGYLDGSREKPKRIWARIYFKKYMPLAFVWFLLFCMPSVWRGIKEDRD